jgi:UDP-N-acetylmuramate: L-alanyl-gamma-D-glutamyl-meso-diaminopimelate ligase
MHIHILGIAGTFMGGVALIAKELGHQISGQDEAIYPPMSGQLKTQDIDFISSYTAKNMPKADLYIIGNALSRGNECVEYILDNNLPYTSGAAWLGKNILKNKWVIALAGTHGKTTTTAMVVHILNTIGLNPSFLIGGIANDLEVSARLTDGIFFVIEADEYDTSFFDKRSKFIHYYPNTLVINNLEFDHADIFKNLDDIYTQFHHLIRTLPNKTQIIYPENDNNIKKLLKMGLWSQTKGFKLPSYNLVNNSLEFELENNKIELNLLGEHNIYNATSALFACQHAGVPITQAANALKSFTGVKRRMEVKFKNDILVIYDDFAHHPTSIQTTIDGLRKQVGREKITIALELRSNTMKMGYFNDKLADSLKGADEVLVLKHLINGENITTYENIDVMINKLKTAQGHLIIMSNGSFDNLTQKLISLL